MPRYQCDWYVHTFQHTYIYVHNCYTLSTVKSLLELVRYIFTIPGVKFFLSERISQEPLENFFGCQRQRGGASENPNVQDFCKNTQALRVIDSVCGSVPRENCRGSQQLVDRQSDYNPLPKHRRIQASKEKLISEQKRTDAMCLHRLSFPHMMTQQSQG